MRKIKIYYLPIFVILFCMIFVGCTSKDSETEGSIIGTWAKTDNSDSKMMFYDDGTCLDTPVKTKTSAEAVSYKLQDDGMLIFTMEWDGNIDIEPAQHQEEALNDSDYYYLSEDTLILCCEVYKRQEKTKSAKNERQETVHKSFGLSSEEIEKATIESDLLKMDDLIIQCPITVGELLDITNGELMDVIPEIEGATKPGKELQITDREKWIPDINSDNDVEVAYIDIGNSRYVEIAVNLDVEDTVSNALCTEVAAYCKNSSAPKGIGIGNTIEDLNEAYEIDMEPKEGGSGYKYVQYGNYLFQFDKEGKNIICVCWLYD